MKKQLIIILAMSIVLIACEKEENKIDNNVNTPQGAFTIEMDHVWGVSMIPFVLRTWYIHPMTNDSMRFTTLKYYISNVKLKKLDGTWYEVPESYYLVDASITNGNLINIDKIPVGEYTELSLLMGVDSIRNVSGAQTGALAPSKEMFWNWNTGYIMIKAEGESPQSSTGTFAFHLGGFSGQYNVVRQKTFSFGSDILRITPTGVPVVHLLANPARFRHTLGSLSNGNTAVHMPGPSAKQMADDFNSWVRFDHIHN